MADGSLTSQSTSSAPVQMNPIQANPIQANPVAAPLQTETTLTDTLHQDAVEATLTTQQMPGQQAPGQPAQQERVSKRSLLSYNPTFKAFMDKLLNEPGMEKDSREMSMVKAALFGIRAVEAEALRKNSLSLVEDELQYMKTSLLEACTTYISKKNPWTTRGKERLNMVKALKGIASGEAMSTPALQISYQIAGADVAAKVVQMPDAGFALLKDKFAECERYRATWTAPQKKILSKIEEYMAKHEVPGVTQNELTTAVKEVIAAFKANTEHPAEPMLSAMWGVSDAFKRIVGPVGGDFIPAGAKHIVYDEDAPGTHNMLSSRYETSNMVSYWSNRRDDPLFTKDPAYSDIKQRFLGHCYMLATLGSIARTEPERIRDMMHDNGNGTVTVRFYKKITEQENKNHGQAVVIQQSEQTRYAEAGQEERMRMHLANMYGGDEVLKSEEYGKWLSEYFETSPEKAQLATDVAAFIEEQTRLRDEAKRVLDQYEATHTEEQRVDASGIFTEEYAALQKAYWDHKSKVTAAQSGHGYVYTRKREMFNSYMEAHPETYSYITTFAARRDMLGLSGDKVESSSNPRFNWDALAEFSQKLFGMGAANPEIKRLADSVKDITKFSTSRAGFAEALGKMPEAVFQQILAECRTEIQKMAQPAPSMEPIYVTVNKTVPSMVMFGEKHSRDALWVQMIAKAYAASGIHEQSYNSRTDSFSDADIETLYKKTKERLTAEEGKKPAEQRLSEEAIKEKARLEISQTYAWIEGGYSDDFAERITGEEHVKDQRFHSFLDQKYFADEATERRTRDLLRDGVASALVFAEEDRIESEKPQRVLSQTGINSLTNTANAVANKLAEMVKNGSVEALTLEDITEAYMEDVTHSYEEAVKEGYVQLFFPAYEEARAEEYRDIFMRRAEESRDRLEHYFETHFSGMSQQVGTQATGTIMIGHRAFATKEDADGQKVGVYSAVATTQFDKIRDRLAAGKPVEAGTYSFSAGVSSLNGEPKSAGFVGGHAYSVVGVSESDGFKFVELFNPHHMTVRNTVKTVDSHGNVSYSYEAGQDETIRQGFADMFMNTNTERTGVFTMEFNDFMNRVSHIYY